MKMTLQQYNELPILEETKRDKMNNDLVNLMLVNDYALREDIKEILEYFITDLGNADFIRLVDKINDKLSKG
jgi:hypothetical protein